MPDALIHVVDDDAALRASVVFLLESVGWQARDYPSAEAFLADADRTRPGCALLDVRMPGFSGLELQRAMRDAGMRLPVIFLTGHGDVSLAVQAMKDGALDMLEKPFRDQALLDAVGRAVRMSLADREADATHRALRALYDHLTPREREVARLVSLGQPNKRIARELDISEKTVHIHRAHVMEKMGVHSGAQLARLLIAIDPAFASDR
jgi:FixJ family two-component response regulator